MLDESRYPLVSENVKSGLKRYVNDGIPTGGFLEAVLCNNLRLSIYNADEYNRATLPQILDYVYWEVPSGCWGSYGAVEKWIAHRGLSGLKEKTDKSVDTPPETSL